MCNFAICQFHTLVMSLHTTGVQLPLLMLKNQRQAFVKAEVYTYAEIQTLNT